MSEAAASILAPSWARSAAPPPLFTISQWADANRRLPATSGARGGHWRTERVPYLRGIMDAVHEPGVHKIALKKCHQVGGSEALHNILGYFIEHDPCPILFVHPTAQVAEEWSKERLSDMIQSTPALMKAVRGKRSPHEQWDGESTLALKMFPGGFLALGGANTPNTFSRRSVRVAIGDDVDRFPAVVAEEGDPADLLENRTTSFFDALTIFVSTPTLKGGRIDTLYERSDQRHYVVACPECEHEDRITWSDQTHFRVGFDGGDATTARLECPHCGAHLTEPDRREMIAGGRWQSTATAKDPGLVGFHLPAMVSTLGNVTLPVLVEKWLSARAKGKESLRVFINTSLAEGWEDRGARVDPHGLMSRRESYGTIEIAGVVTPIEVPASAPFLTAGVDVQDNRFELQVLAWGPGGERWVVDWRSIPGNPKKAETRGALFEALNRKYQHPCGEQLPIHATCVDTGYATEEMYDFVLAYQVRKIFATKGVGGRSGEPIVGKPSEKTYGRHGRPVRLYPINVDDAKTDVLQSLQLVAPGPGYMHVPVLDTIDEEYFAQLCAEHRETRYSKAGVATHTVWVLDRERNEALDTAVLALAAFKLLNPNIRQMSELLEKAVTAAATAEEKAAKIAARAAEKGEPPPVPPAPVPPTRRVARSSYLR